MTAEPPKVSPVGTALISAAVFMLLAAILPISGRAQYSSSTCFWRSKSSFRS